MSETTDHQPRARRSSVPYGFLDQHWRGVLLPTVLMIIAIALRLSPLPSSVAWWTFAASFASAMVLPFLWFLVVLPRSMRDPGVLRRRLHAAGVWCFGGTIMVLVPALVFLAVATLRKSA